MHAVPLVGLERVQRDLWARRADASEDAEVRPGAVRRGAGADGEVHVARVS